MAGLIHTLRMHKTTSAILSLAAALTLVGAGCSFNSNANVNADNTSATMDQEANVNTNDTMPSTDTSTQEEANMKQSAIADGTYVLVASESVINWQGSKTLIANYDDTGTINLKDGMFTVKDSVVTDGAVTFDMKTITVSSTGKGVGDFPGMLEKHLKSDDFFGVEKNPTAEFKVKSVMAQPDNTYMVTGDLTMKGKTNEIVLPARVSMMDGGKLHITADATVDRTKFDIRYGSGKFFDNLADNVIDDNFTVNFDLMATKQ
jgi:polyisoprenoid-binding protein YceI